MTLKRVGGGASVLHDVQTAGALPTAQATLPAPSSPQPPTTPQPGTIGPGAVGGSSYGQIRNVLQIPFDDSVDSTHSLECFFQMPSNVAFINSIKIWVQRKSFRQYVAGNSSDGSHTHTLNGSTPNTNDTTLSGTHDHPTSVGGAVGAQPVTHNHVYQAIVSMSSSGSHSHSLTSGNFDTASTAKFGVDVADDGVNYTAAVASQ